MLLGREPEAALLIGLVSKVRDGGSGGLVVAGEAGIGKSSLLEYTSGLASGMRVLRARGTESERNLPFAGLADMLRPILDYLEQLPERQRASLAGALAVGPAVPADPFAVCAATLSLLAAAAAERPLLALVDDAHWLDAASGQALAFTARRLGNEGIGLVVALRTRSAGELPASGNGFDAARIDTITLHGLAPAASRELLARTGHTIAPAVADRLASGCGGNPLALLRVAAALTGEQLAGSAALPEPLPVAEALRQVLGQRITAAGSPARRLLLLAAADEAADLTELARALADSGDHGEAGNVAELAAAAEDAGLIRVTGARVEFTDPLLRSAAYHAASAAARRAAHRALAGAIDPATHPVRRAWHLASAVVGADEDAAASLDVAATTAVERNAFLAASRASQRAAELTVDPGRASARWMAAGQAAHLGGDVPTAVRLLTRAVEAAPDEASRGDAQLLLANALLWTTRPGILHDSLVAQAEQLLPRYPSKASALLAVAGIAGITGDQLPSALDIATRAAGYAGNDDGWPWLVSHVLLGSALALSGDRAAARTVLQAVAARLGHAGPGGEGPAQGGAQEASPAPALSLLPARLDTSSLRFSCGVALTWCEEHEAAAAVILPAIAAAREHGNMANLPYGLAVAAQLYFRTGDWGRAYATAAEAIEIGTDVGTQDVTYALVTAAEVKAAMGDRAACRHNLETARAIAEARGVHSVLLFVAAHAGFLELGAGDYGQAASALRRADFYAREFGLREPYAIQWRPNYIEALARTRQRAEAERQLAILEAEAAATGSRWAHASAARCRVLLLPPGTQAVAAAERAIGLAAGLPSPFSRARAQLCLGEALRRARSRVAARESLASAVGVFTDLGARPWADRAAAELVACGGDAAMRSLRAPPQATLTPQEMRVALQVAEGLSNNDVAARLFVSPKTVEAHLSSAYAKLGVHSRTALARMIADVGNPG